MTENESGANFRPRILVFSTNLISDVGIDYAGLLHMHYPATTAVIRLPCSSMIRPEWIVLALEEGFDGVFIAADGTDCPYLSDCTDRTARRVDEALKRAREAGFHPERIKMAAICSVCAEPFVKLMDGFYESLVKLGPVKRGEVSGDS
ncbi:MAG: hydrogenase iron-sulfur subunit [Desulfurococcales archaeon]|nr:hydrogenase iron-sulfur subunit [Desulfurococcales archaeon]